MATLPWFVIHRPQWVTKFRPMTVATNDAPEEEAKPIENLLLDLLYDRRFSFGYTWSTGDFLIADNVEVSFLFIGHYFPRLFPLLTMVVIYRC